MIFSSDNSLSDLPERTFWKTTDNSLSDLPERTFWKTTDNSLSDLPERTFWKTTDNSLSDLPERTFWIVLHKIIYHLSKTLIFTCNNSICGEMVSALESSTVGCSFEPQSYKSKMKSNFKDFLPLYTDSSIFTFWKTTEISLSELPERTFWKTTDNSLSDLPERTFWKMTDNSLSELPERTFWKTTDNSLSDIPERTFYRQFYLYLDL
jgi:hypothetical protein